MSGSNVWIRSRERMRLFPELFAQCAGEVSTDNKRAGMLSYLSKATVYGKCVAATTTGRQELQKDLCAKEFEALKSCFANAAKKKAK